MKSLKDLRKKKDSAADSVETGSKNPKKKTKKSFKEMISNRRFRYGSMATVLTVVFIVGVVLVNVIASLVLDRFPVNVDLTSDHIFQLTDESIDYVKNLEEEINITVCSEEDSLKNATVGTSAIGNQSVEIINNYAKYNKNIHVEYVDLLKNPSISRDYAEYGDIDEYSVIISSDKRTKVVSINDFIDAYTNQQTQQTTYQSKAEQVMTSAIMYVSDNEVMSVSVLTGHSELGCEGFTSLLTDNNYEVTEQNIVTEEINPDAKMAVIYAPTTDYSAEELQKLDTFLDNNGDFSKNLIYIASPQQPDLPNLEGFLAEWGISVDDSLVVETDGKNIYSSTGSGLLFGSEYGETDPDYTADLRQPDLPFLVYQARPVNALFDASGNRTTSVLLQSKDSSIAVPLDADASFDMDSAEKQSYGIAVMGQRTRYEGTDPFTSSVVVFGSLDLFNEQFISNAQYNNNEYTVNLMNQICGKENNVNISSVSFDADQLNVTAAQAMVLMVIFLYVLPIAMIVVGVVVWLRRRNK
ncbi:MAG: Gldg family protein [Massiliimalia sp.]|jgi:ABC-2 type transport system permease protein